MGIKKLTNQKSNDVVIYDMCHYCLDIYPRGEKHECEMSRKRVFSLIQRKGSRTPSEKAQDVN